MNIERDFFMWYYVYPPTEKVCFLPFYLHSIGLHELQPPISKRKGYEYDQFFYHEHGSGTLILNGKKYPLLEHYAFFIPAHVPHEYYPDGDVWDVRWMAPGGSGLPDLYRCLGLENGGAFPVSEIAPLDLILNRMHTELIGDKENGNLYASACVMEFIAEFARQAGLIRSAPMAEEGLEDTYSRHIRRLKDYIDYHYMHPVELAELCELIGVSPQHLCRIFKRCTGMRPMEYIIRRRVAAAKNLLANSDHSIGDIAYWCGFDNNNYFWRIFRQIEKMTPGEYRKAHRAQAL